MRTMCVSSSNRNSASARASSVLPTPVGPRKMNEPIGRLGSCRPGARAADGVGDRRRPPRPGRSRARAAAPPCCSRRACSPSSILSTGMPVHFETTAAMSSSVTSSRRNEPCFCGSLSSAALAVGGLLQLGDAAEAQLGGAIEVAAALRQLGLGLGGLDLLLQLAQLADQLASRAARRVFIWSTRSRSSAISAATCGQPLAPTPRPSPCSAPAPRSPATSAAARAGRSDRAANRSAS